MNVGSCRGHYAINSKTVNATSFASVDAPAQDRFNAEIYLRRTIQPGVHLMPARPFFRNPSLDGSGAVVDRGVGVANLRRTWRC